MQIDIKNFGTVQNASVLCNGLTVIAGENDTGKSTVGKLIFSIIKAVSKSEEVLGRKTKEEEILVYLAKINSSLVKVEAACRFFLLDGVEITSFLKEQVFLKEIFLKEIAVLLKYQKNRLEEVEKFINSKKIAVPDLPKKSYPDAIKKFLTEIIDYLDEIKEILLKPEQTKSELLAHALKRVLTSEFKMEVSPKTTTRKTEINWSENGLPLFDITIEKNKVTKFDLAHDYLAFDDVTFIENPIILQFVEMIDHADTLFDIANVENKAEKIARLGLPKVALHIKDLMIKLKNAQYFFDEEDSKAYQTALNIQQIINGKVDFSGGESDFLFSKTKKGQSFNFKSINTASGVKAFGIIQLLILSGIVDDKSLIVVDEPETHLHPKWQVAYAKVLVELVKSGIKVLVTSHSPYFIQAVKVFSEKEGLSEKVNFYLAERQDSISSNINNVTDDLNQIFEKLSQPLQDLVWQ